MTAFTWLLYLAHFDLISLAEAFASHPFFSSRPNLLRADVCPGIIIISKCPGIQFEQNTLTNTASSLSSLCSFYWTMVRDVPAMPYAPGDMANISYGKRMHWYLVTTASLSLIDILRTSISQISASGSEVYHKRRFKDDELFCKSGLDQEGFEKKFISNYIGYGVFTTKNFNKGDFLLEYVGERIQEDEAITREKKRKIRRSYLKWVGNKKGELISTSSFPIYLKNEDPFDLEKDFEQDEDNTNAPRNAIDCDTIGSKSENTISSSTVVMECNAICIGKDSDIRIDGSGNSKSDSGNTITSTVLEKLDIFKPDEDHAIECAKVDNSKPKSGNGDESYHPDTDSSETEESDHENPALSGSEQRDDENPVLSGSEQRDDKNPVLSGSESDDNLSNIFPMLSEPYKNITFLSTAKNSKGNLSNKVHACIYCEQLFQNIARHLELKHCKELEVAKILALQKKSKERRTEWEKLVNRGDFCHNMNVLKDGKGLLIPKYRKHYKSTISTKDYVPCENCMGYYKINDLCKHQKYCVSKDAKKDGNPQYVKNGRLMLPVETSFKELAHKVLVDMHNDEVKFVIESDYRILEMGKRLLEKHGNEQHKYQYIRAKMRELGQYLICCKSVNSDNIKCIDDAINCENWDLMIKCVKKFGEYNEEDHSYQKPSKALKIGHSLKKCSKYMKSEGLKAHDKQKIDKANTFLQLYEQDWKDQISSQALASLETKNYNKPKLLPLTKDVVKFDKYLKEEASALCRDIEKNVDNYSKLAKVCLAQVILFNRKRSGEAERITLKGFTEAEVSGSGRPEPVVMETLSEFEKQLCNTHTRVEIKGKRGRRVPVFDCLKKLAKEAEIENTSTFTSSLLRKQLATLVQILNLSETSQDILATFQGHDIRVHRQFYRLPENVLQAAKVSKVLHSLSDGSIGKYKGKDFDEIEFDEKETVVSEAESEVDCVDTDKQVIPAPAVRHQWTRQEKDALTRHFKKNINLGKTPGQLDCAKAIKNEMCLSGFHWKKIKFAVKNLITAQKRSFQKVQNST
ncbi:hypothetical protein KUTeg_001215 [Tegillarca granosa]|uniref:SET domain-containing protein n=1 Tax=Tegillarca granosa TaxID=220873 RepID=A0ABQ9FVF3_TEGGR|nr:hypothetical protein KUTeg_001215 [Tegillarca granosa]